MITSIFQHFPWGHSTILWKAQTEFNKRKDIHLQKFKSIQTPLYICCINEVVLYYIQW